MWASSGSAARLCLRQPFLSTYRALCATAERALSTVVPAQTAADLLISCLNDSRGVLRLAGPDLFHFLQGLLTNDVTALQQPAAQPLYAALLNAQGRVLHDVILSRSRGEENVLFVDVDAANLPNLTRLLKRYRLRAEVDLDDVSSDYQVWAWFGRGSQQPAVQDEIPPDPRLADLGCRAVLPKDSQPFQPTGAVMTEANSYRLWRFQHGVAEGYLEILSGQAVPLEYNLDGLNGVSYDKGCFVGQELVARSHHLGVVRKRIMPFAFDPGADVQHGANIIVPGSSSKRAVGKVNAADSAAGYGLALLRLVPALEAAEGRQQLIVEQTAVEVRPWRPHWWPQQWGHEEMPAGGASVGV